jgi:hypothetical protein
MTERHEPRLSLNIFYCRRTIMVYKLRAANAADCSQGVKTSMVVYRAYHGLVGRKCISIMTATDVSGSVPTAPTARVRS